MAKNQKRRKPRGRYLKGNVDELLTVGALGAQTLLSEDFDETVAERARISSLVATYSLENFTVGADKGPLTIGVAHSDYSDAEIEAVIESQGTWDEGNKISQELAKRLVRKIGTFEAAAGGGVGTYVLNDGVPIKIKLNWILNSGDTLSLWVYNEGTAALDTTVPESHCQGHANLWML